MAQSTAEELASLLPKLKMSRAKSLYAILWKRNRGYLNRKSTSLLFDLLEVISLSILADIDSLKYFYIIWIIFYFSQNVLESLFYTARKIYIFEKKIPTKRTLAYIHILVVTIPLFFVMVSFERFSHNNIAIIYLLFKATILTIQIFFNYTNFEAQAITRIYYPPSLNWVLLVISFLSIVLVQNFSGPAISFYFVLVILTMARLTQDFVIFKKIRALYSTMLWQKKRDKIETSNSLLEFLTLICIEVFLPLSILSLPRHVIDLKNMALIFLVYMIVKLLMRPIRSLTLDHWSIGIRTNKILIGLTYLAALTASGVIIFQKSIPLPALYLAFTYFNLLILWNTNLIDKKLILLVNALSLIWAVSGMNLSLLPLLHILFFIVCFHFTFKSPSNLKSHKGSDSFENKFLLTFKERPRWAKMARLYPDLTWSPISKKRCVLESKDEKAELQKLVFNHSYEIQLIEKLDSKLAKKFNLL